MQQYPRGAFPINLITRQNCWLLWICDKQAATIAVLLFQIPYNKLALEQELKPPELPKSQEKFFAIWPGLIDDPWYLAACLADLLHRTRLGRLSNLRYQEYKCIELNI